MFVGYQTSTSVGASSPYIWAQKYLTNNNISYNSATGIFSIKTPGWYEIQFDTTAGAVGDVNPVLYVNGVASTYAFGAGTSTGSTNLVNVAFSTVVYVVPNLNNSFATIQVVNEGVAVTTESSNIIIKRIG